MGKGSNTTTTSQNSTYTPTGTPAINTALTAAQSAAATPYQAYNGELTAGVNQEQNTGIAGVNSSANLAQPYYGTAQQDATAAGSPLTAAQIAQYQNPYTQSVVNATQAQFNNQNQQQSQTLSGNAALQGALGGDRVGVAQANLANQQQLAQAPVIAGLYNQSYAQGLATAQQQQQQQGTAAGILGGLGTGAQAAGLSGAGAQIGAGTLQQQTQQAQDTSQYQQFLNQLAYPFQTSQFLTQATASLAPSLGGTTQGQGTTTAPAPSTLGQILGGVATAASFLPSDERIKENKQVIGKMFDGTPIYRFNYKGDSTTRVGLMAQDVERKNPDAVAQTPGGVKMVDHQRATDDAASRQHFAGGGLALPYSGGQGYVPTISSINTAQAPMPQMPSMGASGQRQPDQTNSIINSMGTIGKDLKGAFNYYQPGNAGNLGDDGLGNTNDYTWDGGTPLDGGAAIGGMGGGIGGAARGGRIRGYDDGGFVVPSQDNPGGYDSVPPTAFASYYDPASPVAGGVNVPLNLPQSQGFEPKPDPTIPVPSDSGMAAITQGVPLGELPKAVGYDKPQPPVAPVSQGPMASIAHLDTGAPIGPIADSQGFDAPAPVAAADVPLPPVKPVTGTAPISPDVATNLGTPTAGYASNMDRIAAAHRATESSNNYGALGPVNPNPKSDYYGDRAYGAYQIMGKNIPVWTKEVLGTALTPQQFLNSPEAQDAVYKAKMGQYVNQYGLDGALDKWLGSGKQDFTGTTHDKYRQMFHAALGQPDEGGDIPANAKYGQQRGSNAGYDVSGAPVPEQSWADRHGLTNPFGQSLTPQSDSKGDKDGPSWWPFGKMSDATKQQLMATGLGMLASKSPFPGVALGEGGLQGISVAQKAQELSRQADLARSTIAGQTASTAKTNVETEGLRDTLAATRALRSDPMFGSQAATPGIAKSTLPVTPATGGVPSLGVTPELATQNPALASVAASGASVLSKTATVRNTAAGPVAYDQSGQPIENLAYTRQKAQRLINSLVPAFVSAGETLSKHVDEMVKSGTQLQSDGSVAPIPGAAETQARAAGMKTTAETRAAMEKEGMQVDDGGNVSPSPGFSAAQSANAGAKAGAEARAKFPYEFNTSLARNAGRPTTVGPEQSVITAEQLNPDIKAASDLAKTLMPGGNGQPQVNVPQPVPGVVTASSSGSPAPTLGTPVGPGTSQFTPHLIQNPDGSWGSSVTEGVKALQKDAATSYEKAADAARASQNMKYRLNLVENDLDDLNSKGSSFYNSGAGANGRLEFAKTINSYAGLVGLKQPFDTEKIGKWEDLTKESTQLGFATARTLGAREAMQIVQQAITANPGMANTPAGARLVLNSIRYAAKSDTDFYNYATKYAQEHGGDLVGAQTAFYNEHPPSQYAAAAMAAGHFPNHVANLKAHPETADSFDAKHGKGSAAIILSE